MPQDTLSYMPEGAKIQELQGAAPCPDRYGLRLQLCIWVVPH